MTRTTFNASSFRPINHITDTELNQFKEEVKNDFIQMQLAMEKMMEPFTDKPGTDNKIVVNVVANKTLHAGTGIEIIDGSSNCEIRLAVNGEVAELKEELLKLQEKVHDLEHPNALDVILKRK